MRFLVLKTARLEKLRIFKTATPTTPYGVFVDYSGKTSPNNAAYPFLQCEDSTAVRLHIWSSGDIVNQNDSYGAISDRAAEDRHDSRSFAVGRYKMVGRERD